MSENHHGGTDGELNIGVIFIGHHSKKSSYGSIIPESGELNISLPYYRTIHCSVEPHSNHVERTHKAIGSLHTVHNGYIVNETANKICTCVGTLETLLNSINDERREKHEWERTAESVPEGYCPRDSCRRKEGKKRSENTHEAKTINVFEDLSAAEVDIIHIAITNYHIHIKNKTDCGVRDDKTHSPFTFID